VKKRAISASLFVGSLVLLGILTVNIVRANPLAYEVGPLTKPKITISSPMNGLNYASNNLTISFNIIIPPSEIRDDASDWINIVYYKTSWQQNNTTVYVKDPNDLYGAGIRGNSNFVNFSHLSNLTEISEGKQNITVVVEASGGYFANGVSYFYNSNTSRSVSFTVDTTCPTITFLQMNKTYASSEVPLSFTVSEPAQQTTYVLDGRENITVQGNTTLTALPDGAHNLTIYAQDYVGNFGSSETRNFTVERPIPFPPATFATVSLITGAATCICLLVYFRKRKKARSDS
jgi:hypothetical protein